LPITALKLVSCSSGRWRETGVDAGDVTARLVYRVGLNCGRTFADLRNRRVLHDLDPEPRGVRGPLAFGHNQHRDTPGPVELDLRGVDRGERALLRRGLPAAIGRVGDESVGGRRIRPLGRRVERRRHVDGGLAVDESLIVIEHAEGQSIPPGFENRRSHQCLRVGARPRAQLVERFPIGGREIGRPHLLSLRELALEALLAHTRRRFRPAVPTAAGTRARDERCESSCRRDPAPVDAIHAEHSLSTYARGVDISTRIYYNLVVTLRYGSRRRGRRT
jgi:hypothetical protein